MKKTLATLMRGLRVQASNRLASALLTVSVLLIAAWALTHDVRQGFATGKGATSPNTTLPLTLPRLLTMTTGELSQVDISLLNLVCASGLSGSESKDMPAALTELDRMARQVKTEAERHLRKFQAHPEEFNGSEAYFRMLCLATVLQQDFGIRYNPNRAKPSDGAIEPNEAFFADAGDIFLHGLLGPQRTGTCASLPVLYVAVGRRLGYPMKLVAAKNHLFARWESGREKLNIEATTPGLTTFDDAYYRRWPFVMTPEEERSERYLTSLSPAEELSVFLSLRTQCLLATGRREEAFASQEQVCRLAPYSASQREILHRTRRQAKPLERSEQRNPQTALNL